MSRGWIITVLAALLLFASFPVVAQRQGEPTPPKQQNNRSRQQELSNRFMKTWLEQDATYIITDEEKKAFNALSTDEEREQFIEAFWLRRDPTPDTIENEYRDEHYERIAYANERYASGKPGWKTDRGRIHIVHGKPDSVESYPAGGPYQRKFEEGGGSTTTYPFEVWTYRWIEGIGNNVELEFVDPSMSGEYRLTIDPDEKDAMRYIPGAGLTLDEELNGGDKSQRSTRNAGDSNSIGRYNQFDRLDLFAKIFKPPETKFKDLEAIVTTKLSFNTFPFDMRMDFVRITEESVLTPITLQFRYKDLAFQEQQGVHVASAHVFGRITSVNGRIVQQFEDPIGQQIPGSLFQSILDTNVAYQRAIPLRPGLYKLDLVVKDVNSGNVGTLQKGFQVPRLAEDKLSTSTLIIADRIEKLAATQVATGQFILGGSKVVPSVREEFRRDQELKLWLQVYSLKVDEGTHKPSATVETLITRDGREVKKFTEDSTEFSGAAQQMTITKNLGLTDFEPGEYAIQLKVTDNLTKEVIAKTGKFRVR